MTKKGKTSPPIPLTPHGTVPNGMTLEVSPDDQELLQLLTRMINTRTEMTNLQLKLNQQLMAISKHVMNGIILAQPDFPGDPDHGA